MKKTDTKFSHRVIAIFFTLTFLQTLIPYNQLWANNNGPNAPEAASFEPVDATDMVNLLTGDFSYVLPLLNVPSPEGGYPLALAYHAGIAMDQEASWVGLGWNLNPGAINRSLTKSPDDWYNARSYNIITSGVNTNTRYGFTVGLGKGDGTPGGSIGLYVSRSENRAFTGETQYRTDFGIQGGINLGVLQGASESSPFSLNGSIGTDGASGGVGLNLAKHFDDSNLSGINPSFTMSQSFRNGSTTASLSVASGTGISLNSKEGLGGSILGKGIGLNNSIGGAITPNISSSRLGIITPFFSISYSRTKFWVFEADYAINQGSLYAGAMDEILQSSIFETKVDFDSYESNNPFKSEVERGNFTFAGYDNYTVSGQGVSGNMHPQLLESSYLYNKERVISSEFGNGVFMVSQYPKSSQKFTKRMDAGGASDVHFYFQNEFSSYLDINTTAWNPNQSSSTDIFGYDNLNLPIDSDLYGETMYKSSSNRIRKGKYVETYTNEELRANPNLVFVNGQIDRSNETMTPGKGIGAFKITTIDGKTYHYTIPVYQREQVTRSASEEYNIEENFSENQQFEPYATHWLLTGITGPDYVDFNGNNKLDASDYGYWIAFDYGKWSDGYAWRNPKTGESVFEKTKLYSWGVKDVYYLDKIQTRTHTALFVKEDRKDNMSSTIDIPRGSNELKWFEDIHHKKYVGGNDGNVYLSGIYGTNSSTFVISANTFHGYKFKTYKQKSLRLDKILILDNDDIPSNLSKSNPNQSAPKNLGNIEVRERIEGFDAGGRRVVNKTETIHQRSWQGEFYANVLDKNDLTSLNVNLEEKASEVIDFAFDEAYPLAKGSFNSDANSKGRLTLKSVSFAGHGGKQLIPNYNFDYAKKYIQFNKDEIDAWGYYENNPDAWSLNSIEFPTGGKIQVNYESDEIDKEIAQGFRVFTRDIQFSLSNDSSGNKRLLIRNNPAETDKIDFRNYYETGKQAYVDALYWRHPPGNSSHRIADVARYCTVVSVAQDQVSFAIPNTHFSPDVRRDQNCNKDNWVYYRNYGGLTGGWFDAIDSNNCGDPRGTSNGTRVRYTFIANKSHIENKKQGGIRVAEVITTQNNESYKTTYEYKDFANGRSSGVTIHSPSNFRKSVDFLSELPSPQVMYKNIKVSKYGNDELYGYTNYTFNVFDNITYTNEGFDLDGILSLVKSQDQESLDRSIETRPGNIENVDINFSKHKLLDNTSTLGTLLEVSEFNSKNQLISKTENEYGAINSKHGSTQESFKNVKLKVTSGKKKYFLNSSSRETNIAVLKKTKISQGGHSQITEFISFDPLTGKVIETQNELSDGVLMKQQEFLAKNIDSYNPSGGYGMGSKVDNPTNKNMLTQTAANRTQVKVGNTWKTINAGITTWSNAWTYRGYNGELSYPNDQGAAEKIWRTHKTYIWDGATDTDGGYIGYAEDFDGFNWGVNATQTNPEWVNTSTVNLYDHNSMALEYSDINQNSVSTILGDNSSKILATANASYTEAFYSGAEYIHPKNTGYFDGEVRSTGQSQDKAHTGKYSVKTTSAIQGFRTFMQSGQHRTGKYKVSVWADAVNHSKARIYAGSGLVPFNGEIIPAGDWVLMNHYVDISASEAKTIFLSSTGTTYFDDFRIHPVESSMTSYVFNQWDELTHTIGANNLAVRYEYDDVGRLRKTYSEVVDASGVTGGFKLTKEIVYNYKRVAEVDSDGDGEIDPIENYPNLGANLLPNNTENYQAIIEAQAYGGSGNFQYRWASGPSETGLSFGSWTTNNTITIYTQCGDATYVLCEIWDVETDNVLSKSYTHLRSCSNNDGDILSPVNQQ